MAAFYEVSERKHPELRALAPSPQQKVRSALLQMIRDAGLLLAKASKGGAIGTVQRLQLSPQVQEQLMQGDPDLLFGFLQVPIMESPRRKQPATHRQTAKTDKPSTKPKAKTKAARQPAANTAGATRRASA